MVKTLWLLLSCLVRQVTGLTITVTCDDKLRIYFDTVEQSAPNLNSWTVADTFTLPSSVTILGLHCIDTGGLAGIIASLDDGQMTGRWNFKCSNQYSADWLSVYFDDSNWGDPVSYGTNIDNIWNRKIAGIADEAEWVWTPGTTTGSDKDPVDSNIYCRTSVKTVNMGANCDDEMHWFIDGVEKEVPNANNPSLADGLLVPVITDVIAISCTNTGGSGFLAATYSDGRKTDSVNWRCSNIQFTDWEKRDFDDSIWSPAHSFGTLSSMGIYQSGWSSSYLLSTAVGIWTGGTYSAPKGNTVYCRSKVRINGGWTTWSAGTCTCPSGLTGTQTRMRTCTNPAPNHFGRDCEGVTSETVDCTCKINGNWGAWSQGSCNCAAGVYNGTRVNSRVCDSPPPAYGGANCVGDSSLTETCNCPRDGNWGAWVVSVCPCTPDLITSSRQNHRQCDNPEPAYGGAVCVGDNSATETCVCPVDGGVGEWTIWDGCNCPATSTSGTQTRTRMCNNSPPLAGGAECNETLSESEPCKCGESSSGFQFGLIHYLGMGLVGALALISVCSGLIYLIIRMCRKKSSNGDEKDPLSLDAIGRDQDQLFHAKNSRPPANTIWAIHW